MTLSERLIQLKQERTSPKLRWVNYATNTISKSSPDYVRMLTGVGELQSTAYEKELEKQVRKQLAAEFPGVEKMKSYESLVDAVMLNIKQKQIEQM